MEAFATMADRIRTMGKTTTKDRTNKTSSFKPIDDKKTQLSTNNKNIVTLNNIIAQKLAGIVDKNGAKQAKQKAARDVTMATKCANDIVEQKERYRLF